MSNDSESGFEKAERMEPMSAIGEVNRIIPKTIHYCWFGGSELPAEARRAITTWVDQMRGYEIIRWDESNFDVTKCTFCHEAYEARKYAFVSDYARFKIIEEYGGIYMDVGSTLIRSIEPLAERGAFSAREWETCFVSPGLILAAAPHNHLIEATARSYERMGFEDSSDFFSTHTVNSMFARVLEPYGYKNKDELWEAENFTVYPSEYFSPKLTRGGFRITENTYSTHQGSASWTPEHERYRVRLINELAPVIGDFAARKTARLAMMAKYRRRR